MPELPSDGHAPRGDGETKIWEQFPVDVKIVRGVRFETNDGRGDLLRIVVMNDRATAQYASYREYHGGNIAIFVDDVSSFTLRSSRIEETEQAIDGMLGVMSTPLEIPQVVSFCRGIYTPSGARSRLYKAVDPDDSTKMMGVLIEQDARGILERVTWYKTWSAGAAFAVIPDVLEFVLVKDERGAPSLDPNDIGGCAWHYSTTFGIGPSLGLNP
ncbi:hypothetical protein [Polyangium jinanense]|uniref:Uncharacterized protein n=1 Tax=Polyangium jinanense TaxID=2829994 RepID=A0A9X3X4N8_9BACT|nr:hypothetical protein [Polyangium jinanense]MDC3956334.1 hypothetical protein [Polyangium jinanense]MDC3982470.1 hypothetical protein [Polyangium jinanense]